MILQCSEAGRWVREGQMQLPVQNLLHKCH